jgi:hypothetical protein
VRLVRCRSARAIRYRAENDAHGCAAGDLEASALVLELHRKCENRDLLVLVEAMPRWSAVQGKKTPKTYRD